MAIDAISQSIPTIPPPATAPAETDPPQPTAIVPAVEPPPEPVVEDESDDKAAGVLRKLQEGHFKGVADVRLRINFADEIAAAESSATAAAATGALGDLAGAVNTQVTQLASLAEVTDDEQTALGDAQAAFSLALADTTAAAGETSPLDGEAIIDSVQDAFDVLIAALEPLLIPPPPEDPGDPIEPPPDPLQALRDAFEAALVDLTEALNPESSLPPISPPMGNGVAFEKFMAMYNELHAPAATDPEPELEPDPPTEPIDTIV